MNFKPVYLLLIVAVVLAASRCLESSELPHEYKILKYYPQIGGNYEVSFVYDGIPSYMGENNGNFIQPGYKNNSIITIEVSQIKPSWDSKPHFIIDNTSFYLSKSTTLYLPVPGD